MVLIECRLVWEVRVCIVLWRHQTKSLLSLSDLIKGYLISFSVALNAAFANNFFGFLRTILRTITGTYVNIKIVITSALTLPLKFEGLFLIEPCKSKLCKFHVIQFKNCPNFHD